MQENELKEIILQKYRSLRDFALDINMPTSTLDSILKRGIENSNVGSAIKICKALGLSIDAMQDDSLLECKASTNSSPDKLSDVRQSLIEYIKELPDERVAAVHRFLQEMIDGDKK